VSLAGSVVAVVGAGYEGKRRIHRRLQSLGVRLVIVDEPGHWSSALVDEGIAATDAVTPKDMGKVMGWLKPKVAGRADGKKLSDLVRGRLGG